MKEYGSMKGSRQAVADRQKLLDLAASYNYDSLLHVLAQEARDNAAGLRKEAAEHPEMDLKGAADFWAEQAGILTRAANDLRC